MAFKKGYASWNKGQPPWNKGVKGYVPKLKPARRGPHGFRIINSPCNIGEPAWTHCFTHAPYQPLSFRFEKGHLTWNKDLKGYSPVGSPKIQKGERLRLAVLFTERKVNGYWIIKIAHPKKWMLKHRYIYEKHFGKLPDGHVVKFKNGNREDFRLDNLVAIPRKNLLQMVSLHGAPEHIKPLVIASAILTRTINYYERKRKEQGR